MLSGEYGKLIPLGVTVLFILLGLWGACSIGALLSLSQRGERSKFNKFLEKTAIITGIATVMCGVVLYIFTLSPGEEAPILNVPDPAELNTPRAITNPDTREETAAVQYDISTVDWEAFSVTSMLIEYRDDLVERKSILHMPYGHISPLYDPHNYYFMFTTSSGAEMHTHLDTVQIYNGKVSPKSAMSYVVLDESSGEIAVRFNTDLEGFAQTVTLDYFGGMDEYQMEFVEQYLASTFYDEMSDDPSAKYFDPNRTDNYPGAQATDESSVSSDVMEPIVIPGDQTTESFVDASSN